MDHSVYITPRFFVFASEKEEDNLSSSFDEEKIETSTSDNSWEQDLLEQVTLTNHILVGIILFIGIFFGAFCMSHLFNRIKS